MARINYKDVFELLGHYVSYLIEAFILEVVRFNSLNSKLFVKASVATSMLKR